MILSLVASISAGLIGRFSSGSSEREAFYDVKHAFTRARLLAESAEGAVMESEGNILTIRPGREDSITLHVALPRGWTLEPVDYSLDTNGLASFDSSGCTPNASYIILGPHDEEIAFEYLGLTGQIVRNNEGGW